MLFIKRIILWRRLYKESSESETQVRQVKEHNEDPIHSTFVHDGDRHCGRTTVWEDKTHQMLWPSGTLQAENSKLQYKMAENWNPSDAYAVPLPILPYTKIASGSNFIIHFRMRSNQLEKLEAAKAAWLVYLAYWVLLGPSWPYWALLSLTGPYLALLGHTGPY